jgi:hypothetical protein
MQRSQICSGDIVSGGHRFVIVGLNSRDTCGGAAQAVSEALGFSITQLKRIAQTTQVGQILRLTIEPGHSPTQAVIGLVLRRDRALPIQVANLQTGMQQLVRYLGCPCHTDLQTHDVAMVAAGCGMGRLDGGFATLLRVLIDVNYPGVVYEPMEPEARLSAAEYAAMGIYGLENDPLPPWRCPTSDWVSCDDRDVIGVGPYVPATTLPHRPLSPAS